MNDFSEVDILLAALDESFSDLDQLVSGLWSFERRALREACENIILTIDEIEDKV